MQTPGQAVARPRPALAAVPRFSFDTVAVSAWLVGFAPVAYLSFANGGYDTIVRNEVGIAVWWIALVGALAGLAPARLPAPAWAAIGLLAAFVLWTGLSTGWSESAER